MIIFISILGGLLLIAGLCLISLFLINKMFFAPPPFDNNSRGRKIEDYPCRKVAFKSGKNTLDGFILNENGEKGVVIVAHGMGNTVDYYIPEILLSPKTATRFSPSNIPDTEERKANSSAFLRRRPTSKAQSISSAKKSPSFFSDTVWEDIRSAPYLR